MQEQQRSNRVRIIGYGIGLALIVAVVVVRLIVKL
jgi:predicted nucleic acid-binding Zn ribbon protein